MAKQGFRSWTATCTSSSRAPCGGFLALPYLSSETEAQGSVGQLRPTLQSPARERGEPRRN